MLGTDERNPPESAPTTLAESIAKFKKMNPHDKASFPIEHLTPSQVDDGREVDSLEAIPVYLSRVGKLELQQGNHRYYTQKRRGRKYIRVEKVGDASY